MAKSDLEVEDSPTAKKKSLAAGIDGSPEAKKVGLVAQATLRSKIARRLRKKQSLAAEK